MKRLLANLICDRCGAQYIDGPGVDAKVKDLRAQAKAVAGWRYYNLHGQTPEDICADCGPIKGRYRQSTVMMAEN